MAKRPTGNEIAWAAGLFEGEGSVIPNRNRRQGRVNPVLGLASTDKDTVDRFQSVVQCGRYWVKPPPKENWKQAYLWRAGARKDVIRVLALFWPYLGERRKARTLEILQTRDLACFDGAS